MLAFAYLCQSRFCKIEPNVAPSRPVVLLHSSPPLTFSYDLDRPIAFNLDAIIGQL